MAQAQQLTSEITECIRLCSECANMCLETAHHCLTIGGKHAEAAHIGLLNNCSTFTAPAPRSCSAAQNCTGVFAESAPRSAARAQTVARAWQAAM
jgi:hypothetical protein